MDSLQNLNLPSSPPSPSPLMKQKTSYLAIFAGATTRTLAVGFGLTVLFLVVGIATELTKKSQCNISVRTLHGEVSTYSYDVSVVDAGMLVRDLARDEDDENIKGIILDIDSPGGSPVAGEEIANQLLRMSKPNSAVIRGVGASAAYWAAVGADSIFASRSSDVGSIGVIVSFPDESEKNKRDGISYNEFASGKYKNLGTPTRPVTKEEKVLLEEGIADVYAHFIDSVSIARNMATATVRALADGSSLTGKRAQEKGLVDYIGDIEDARIDMEEQIGEKAVLCEPDAVPFF
jgi:protease-4